MKVPKYYFAFVRTKLTYYKSDGIPILGNENEFQITLDVHPLDWQIEYNKEHEMMPVNDYGTFKHMTQKMTVISWQRLTLEEYNNYKDIINGDE